jgi:quercetin dioxygenase-like cupin family protein
MRIRKLKIEPGGVAAIHSHAQRPAFTYVLSGTLVEHRKGAPDRTYKAGEVLVESTDVEHWAENTGSEPVVLVSVDLFKDVARRLIEHLIRRGAARAARRPAVVPRSRNLVHATD